MQALRVSRRGYVLEHGHLAHAGEAATLLEDEAVRSAYLGL
jgi:branched-chain amino acid transport system ATP-binding protein